MTETESTHREFVEALVAWAVAGIRMIEAGEASIVGADIDELPSDPYVPRPIRRTALNAFVEMVGRVTELRDEYSALLALPLRAQVGSTRLPTRYPSLARTLDDPQSRHFVPAFYIGPQAAFLDAFRGGESFKRELDVDLDAELQVVAYYNAYRPAADREKDWEFMRSFEFRTLPPGYETGRLGFVENP